jgi:hypothetical protein
MINSWKMRWAGCVARKEKRGKMYTMILEKIERIYHLEGLGLNTTQGILNI